MEIDTNSHRERIAYNYPYGEALTEDEESLYWLATKDAEDALARIAEIQERRKGNGGKIKYCLLGDELQELNEPIEQLGKATTLLQLVNKAARWSDEEEERRLAALDEIAEERDWDISEIIEGEA